MRFVAAAGAGEDGGIGDSIASDAIIGENWNSAQRAGLAAGGLRNPHDATALEIPPTFRRKFLAGRTFGTLAASKQGARTARVRRAVLAGAYG